MKNFLEVIKERIIKKWFTIYISSVVNIIGVVPLISLLYCLPDYFNIIFTDFWYF